MKKLLAAIGLIAALVAAPLAHAASTVNPNVPISNAPLQSAPMRNNFAAAATDINNILSQFGNPTAPNTPSIFQQWMNTSGCPTSCIANIWDGSLWTQVGTLNQSTHTYSVALNSGQIVATAPVTVGFSLGVATLGLNYDSNFTVTATNLAFNPIISGNLLANSTSGTAEPTTTTLTALLDLAMGSTQGSILERSVSVWRAITPGTTAYPLVSNGAATDPAYQLLTGAGIAATTVANSNLVNSTITLGVTQMSLGSTYSTVAGAFNFSTSVAVGGCTIGANALCVTGGTALGNTAIGAGSAITSSGPGGIMTSAAYTTPAALTQANDTNVTLTLGGTPSTALLQATSITAGWTGTLAAARGGSGQASPTAHAVLLGEGASAFGLVTVGTGGRALLDQGAGADPAFEVISGDAVLSAAGALTVSKIGGVSISLGGSFSTSATLAITAGATNQLALWTGSTAMGGLATANNGVLVTSGAGAPSISSTLPSGIAATNMALTAPSLGVATATSIAINGATIGANALAVTGSVAISSTLTSTAHTITSAAAGALAVGLNGATNPAFNVDASTALQVAGFNIKGAVTGGTVALSVIDSGSNANLSINAKGSGTIGIGSVSTGAVTITPPVTMSAAITYGGVTLTNAVTGTGSMVLDSGSSIANLTVTGSFTATGLVTNADLANSTISGVALGSNLLTLTFGTHLTTGGASYNGSAGVTITSDATNANTVSTIVARDGSGSFSAGTITASLTGHASLDCVLTGCALTGATSIASASANAFAVGLAGTTNPAFNVDASTASQAAGLNVSGAASGGTVAIRTIDSGASNNLTINAKGTGTIGIGSVSTGAVTITPALTLSNALTYGGVTFANTVTGSGSIVGSIAPVITGHPTIEGVTSTGAQGTGAFVFATAPSISSLTVTTAFTATGLVTNADLANSTISGVSLGSNLFTLTFGTHLISGGSSYNGSAGVTITSDATAVNTVSTIMARDGSGNYAAGQGTLASLIVSGNVNFSSISGGAIAGAVCQDSSGNLVPNSSANCYPAGAATAAGTAAGQVQYNASGVGGSLAANGGFSYDGTSVVSLGIAGTSVGGLKFFDVTSGYIELVPTTGALGSAVATLPDNTGTIAETNLAQTFSAAQSFNNGDFLLNGSSSGSMTLNAPAAASTYVMTFPAATDTVAALGTTQTFTGTESFTGSSSRLAAVLTNAGEVATVSATAATGTIEYYPSTQSVLYYTTNASANWTVDFKFSSGTTLDSAMSTGQSMTVAFLVTQGSTAYYNSAITIDGNASGAGGYTFTVVWVGGAPTKGNASGIDAYTYTFVKTATKTFTIFATQTQFKS